MFMSTMTGNVIMGSAVVEKVDIGEPSRISDFGAEKNVISNNVELENGA